MTNEKMLRDIVKSKGLKWGYIAEKMSITRFGLLNKVTNKTEFTASEITCLTELLGLSREQRDIIFLTDS